MMVAPTARVDLTNCDTEPIHIPGSIQPHGVLLAVNETSTTVEVASGNVEELLGLPLSAILGAPLSAALGDGAASAVRAHAKVAGLGAEGAGVPLRLEHGLGRAAWTGLSVEAVMHRSSGLLVVELEPDAGGGSSTPLSHRSTRVALNHLATTTTVRDLAQVLATEVRTLTAHDRVMVYRFDADWNGEVIAEDRREDLEPFLGLHYPATDIPVQARRLYTTSWTRVIADVVYRASPLVSAGSVRLPEELDLSLAVLRSVSPIHIEYLTNMGVRASMSISLIQDGRLWGLVACHHYTGPRCPSYDVRSAAEFVGQVASQLLKERQASDDRAASGNTSDDLVQLTGFVARDPRAPLEALADHPELLLRLTGATGVVLGTGDRTVHLGVTPDDDTVHRIVPALTDSDGRPLSTDHLATLGADLASDRAAGALLVREGNGIWVLWLRPEVQQTVDWAGDPRQSKTAAGDGPQRLTPRTSFARWREVVRGRSLPWRSWQVDAARQLGATVSATLARRTQEQLSIIQDLHDVLGTSSLPTIPGLELHADYRPADGGFLGGDWWDVLPLPDRNRVALVLGDVAGHGVAAAATMSQVRISLRAFVLGGAGPATVLRQLDALVAHLYPDDLVTALVAVLDLDSGQLELARAGAPEPLVASRHDVRSLPVPGRPPLGVNLGSSTQPLRVTLAPGTTLLMFSDGLVERRNASLSDGLADVLAAAGHPADDLAAWSRGLLDATPGPAPDDTTLLIARRTT